MPNPSHKRFKLLLKRKWSFYAFDTLRSFVWLIVLEIGVPVVPTDVGDKLADCFPAFEFVGVGTV